MEYPTLRKQEPVIPDICGLVLLALFVTALVMMKRQKLGFGPLFVTENTFPKAGSRTVQHNRALDKHITRQFD